jgi:hypothetical protein
MIGGQCGFDLDTGNERDTHDVRYKFNIWHPTRARCSHDSRCCLGARQF